MGLGFGSEGGYVSGVGGVCVCWMCFIVGKGQNDNNCGILRGNAAEDLKREFVVLLV